MPEFVKLFFFMENYYTGKKAIKSTQFEKDGSTILKKLVIENKESSKTNILNNVILKKASPKIKNREINKQTFADLKNEYPLNSTPSNHLQNFRTNSLKLKEKPIGYTTDNAELNEITQIFNK